MIVTDHDDLKTLMAGGDIDVQIGSRPPSIGATVSVQPAVGEKTVLRAEVLDVWTHKDPGGGWVVLLGGDVVVLRRQLPKKKAVRRVIIREEPVRLMKHRRGDTADPRYAMSNPHAVQLEQPDKTGVPHPNLKDSEPEMVPRAWKDSGVDLRASQQATLDQAQRERLSLGAQLDALLNEARTRDVDAHKPVHDRVRRIRRELQLLEQELGAAA